VNATPEISGIQVSWTAPANTGGSPITSYTATANPGAKTCTVTGTPPATGCTITGLTNGQAYTITATSHNTAGDSAPSTSTAATPRTTPGPPTAVNATPANAQAAVTWTAPADTGGSPITSYTATANPGGKTCTVTGTPPATGCTITGLTNGTAYTITVSATNEVGDGTPSTPTTPVTPKAPQAPSQVLAVVALAGNSIAGVYWTAPASDGGSPIVSYTVTASPGGASCVVTGAPPATNCTIGGLINGQAYTFTVIASNAIGSAAPSTLSAPVVPAAPIPPNTIPGAPRIVKLKVGKKLIKVWFRAGTNGGLPIDAYQVRCKGPKVRTALRSRSPISVKIRKTGKYRCSVVAHNAIGWGPFTPWSGKVTVKN
ncbi:MAG: fibronectin type III domain-containing protein, partial [Actinomycetes bacterium]